MQQLVRHLTDQELLDRLARLTEHLASCRGLNVSYDFCKMDIEETQQEIEYRKLHHLWQGNHSNGSVVQ
ncbi:hypothetical protein [Sediminibacterium soli]|uniref:hypothetical protein n=1 Tax=Sediminibacterium soli TaxID=2698829 RepID=UPI00137987F4|nr:hypothetical protein [Sediminibacterium soli]NCI45113.1 hypothetical protein [Sediminibacterium soli]